MTATDTMTRSFARFPLLAVCAYVLIVGGLMAVTGASLAAIYEHQRALAETASFLDQLEGRTSANAPGAPSPGAGPTGSPFLEGPTITVAGAALLQRVAAAIVNVGGSVQSSQVDVKDEQAKDGLISLAVSCEMEQQALQKVLYDVEAGMPFLFVDQLDVQLPQPVTAAEGAAARVRVMLGVSGQWRGSK